ncbi:MAG TPA: glycosyltransferase family 9 protein [Verrucomicrobiae bacterium]|jgi:heptosyltransferase-4|nr:glycosyltransferase family 9 protein [Verrucomicrobiae bacterium]
MIQTREPDYPTSAATGRLMILNIGRIGDTILRNSILDSAFRTFEKVDYICGRHNAELLRSDKRLNSVTVFRNSPKGFAALVSAAMRRRYDGFIDLKNHPSSISLILAKLFRSRVKTGCNHDRFQPFDRDVRSVSTPALHILETMRRIGRLAGLAPGDYKPSIVLPPDASNWFQQNYPAFNQPFIFLNVSATSPERVWPIENWARYVRGCGLANQSILVSGLPKDHEMVKRLVRELPGTVAFQPKGFMHVAAAIKAAQLVLTVDTGIVHACSAFDKPLVAFYVKDTSLTAYESLSTWRLIIRPQTGRIVPDIDPAQAIAETRNRGLPHPF